MVKLVIFDLDGTLIEYRADGASARVPCDVKFMPGVVDALSMLRDAGYKFAIATNQPDIMRGIASAEQVTETLTGVAYALDCFGIHIECSHVCPHTVHDKCACRKPLPKLLESSIEYVNGDARSTWMIGDRKSDSAAAQAAGVRGIQVDNDNTPNQLTLVDAAQYIIAEDARCKLS